MPVGTSYVISYFGPRSPFGLAIIGSGCWPKAAGKNPAASARSIIGEPVVSVPLILIGLPSPGPVIVASDGPLAEAAAGRTSAAAASRKRRRFMQLLSR